MRRNSSRGRRGRNSRVQAEHSAARLAWLVVAAAVSFMVWAAGGSCRDWWCLPADPRVGMWSGRGTTTVANASVAGMNTDVQIADRHDLAGKVTVLLNVSSHSDSQVFIVAEATTDGYVAELRPTSIGHLAGELRCASTGQRVGFLELANDNRMPLTLTLDNGTRLNAVMRRAT